MAETGNAEAIAAAAKAQEEAKQNQKRKPHPTLGEYVKVIVYPTALAQKNTSIFASIGLYTAEFQPETEVELPKGIVTFLKEATVEEHYFDQNGISANGNKGVHTSRAARKFIVETV